MSSNGRDVLAELHEWVRDLLVDLAVDEEDDLTESELEEVEESMDEIAQMLLDSLDPLVVAVPDEGEDGECRVLLSVRLPAA